MPNPNYTQLYDLGRVPTKLVCMMVWPGWGATNTSGRESTWGLYALKQKYHLPSKCAVFCAIFFKKFLFFYLVTKKILKFFFTKFYLKSTKFYHILLSFTSSGTQFYQIPERTPAPPPPLAEARACVSTATPSDHDVSGFFCLTCPLRCAIQRHAALSWCRSCTRFLETPLQRREHVRRLGQEISRVPHTHARPGSDREPRQEQVMSTHWTPSAASNLCSLSSPGSQLVHHAV